MQIVQNKKENHIKKAAKQDQSTEANNEEPEPLVYNEEVLNKMWSLLNLNTYPIKLKNFEPQFTKKSKSPGSKYYFSHTPQINETSKKLKRDIDFINNNVIPVPKSPLEKHFDRILITKRKIKERTPTNFITNPKIAAILANNFNQTEKVELPKLHKYEIQSNLMTKILSRNCKKSHSTTQKMRSRNKSYTQKNRPQIDDTQQYEAEDLLLAKSTIDAIDSAINKRKNEEKPIFVCSTNSKKTVINKRCFVGKLIGTIQKKLPPALYRANRGDETSLLPNIVKQNTRSILGKDLNTKLKIQDIESDYMNTYEKIDSNIPQNLCIIFDKSRRLTKESNTDF